MSDGTDNHDQAPGSSLWPVGFAIGIACILVGLVISWPAAVLGAALTIVFGVLWIRDGARSRAPVDSSPAHALVDGTPSEAQLAAEEQHLETYGRAGFLTLATIGLGGVIGAGVVLPSLGFAVLPSFTGEGIETNPVDLGPISNFPEGTFVITSFTGSKRQGAVSRRTAYIRNNGLTDKREPSFTIIYSRCVHLGCPCHGGAYDTEGNRTAGPPVRSLDRYAFSIVDGNLILGDHFSVGTVDGTAADAVMTRYPVAYPGVHVDGIERFLYPLPMPGAGA